MELLIKVNDSASYKDGDVVDARCLDGIHFTHAGIICNTKNFGFNTSGMRDRDTLLEKFLVATHSYKFERVNANDVRVTNLITEEQSIVNKTPNPEGHYMNAEAFLSIQLRSSNHKIFGTDGSEVWYGGLRTDDRANIVSLVWDIIESETDHLKSDHNNWPFSEIAKRHFVCINTSGRKYSGDSFTRVELSGDTVYERRSIVTEEPSDSDGSEGDIPSSIILAKRRWFVPYWDLTTELGETVDKLRSPYISCDCRKPMNEREHVDILTYDKITEGLI